MKKLGLALLLGGVMYGCALAQTPGPVPRVALTVDDLPETDDLAPGQTRLSVIQSIVKALHDAGAPRVYGFVNAQTLVDEPWLIQVLETWRSAGFMLGNHTYTHSDPNAHTVADYERDIAKDEPLLQSLMVGEDWHWFRYPYLHEGSSMQRRNALREYLNNHGYRVAQVTIDFHDYLWNQPYVRCSAQRNERALQQLETLFLHSAAEEIRVAQARSQRLYGRDIPHVLLLHDGAIEAVMLPKLIQLLKEQRFELTTLEESQRDPAYQEDPGIASLYGGTMLEQMMFVRHLKDGPVVPTPEHVLATMCRAGRK